MHESSDNYLINAVNAIPGHRSVILFDYDSTIARIPIDWTSAREGYRAYLRNHLPKMKLKAGLRLDEMESIAFTIYPEEFKLIFAYRSHIEKDKIGNHEPVDVTIKFLNKASTRNYFIISNNLHSTLIAGLNQLGLMGRFDGVIGIDDTHSPKPSTKSLKLIRKRISNVENKSIFIGDSDDTDGGFCLRSKIPFINISTKKISIYEK